MSCISWDRSHGHTKHSSSLWPIRPHWLQLAMHSPSTIIVSSKTTEATTCNYLLFLSFPNSAAACIFCVSFKWTFPLVMASRSTLWAMRSYFRSSTMCGAFLGRTQAFCSSTCIFLAIVYPLYFELRPFVTLNIFSISVLHCENCKVAICGDIIAVTFINFIPKNLIDLGWVPLFNNLKAASYFLFEGLIYSLSEHYCCHVYQGFTKQGLNGFLSMWKEAV